jgi:hypothetical protein
MSERPWPYHPHLWVPYTGNAEICTLCGEFMTLANAGANCPENLPEDAEAAEIRPAGALDEPPEGADDELRQGAITPP